MTTYQWIAVVGVLVTLIGGTLLTSLLTALILWFKTKGLVDYKMKEHGERIGTHDKKLEHTISNADCSNCRKEQERLGEILINQNNKDHIDITSSIGKLYTRTDDIGKEVTIMSGKVDNIANGKL